MNKLHSMRIIVVIVLCCLSATCVCQNPSVTEPKPPQKLQFGFGFCGFTYQGDLNNTDENLHRIYPGLNISLQFDSRRRVSPQINFGLGKFIAQNNEIQPIEGQLPNAFVATNFYYFDLQLRVHFLKKKKIRPHLGFGLGMLNFTPRDEKGNELNLNQSTRANSENQYSTSAFVTPLNIGLKISLNEVAGIGFDFNHYITNSDFLDNIGKLGTKNGNDALQQLVFTFYLTPKIKGKQ